MIFIPDILQRERDCETCGHPASWHRHDDSDNVPPTDPSCKFRCIGYDCEVGGAPPKNPCKCPDYKVTR